MISTNLLQEILSDLRGQESLNVITGVLNQLIVSEEEINLDLVINSLRDEAQKERKRVARSHSVCMDFQFHSATVIERLKGRLKRESINIGNIDIEGKQGGINDLYRIYIVVRNKKVGGHYINLSSQSRTEILEQVSQIISVNHWSLGKDRFQSNDEELVYYWPSNIETYKAA